jgi:UDP-N-acetylglucosamine pyrophosphorylase
MGGKLVQIITASDPAIRNRSLDAICRAASLNELLAECEALEKFRQRSENLYERVRALFFLYAIHRFHLPEKLNGARIAPAFGGCEDALTFSAQECDPQKDLRTRQRQVLSDQKNALIPFAGYEHLLQRRFEEAIEIFLGEQNQHGASDAISSALASAYYRLGIQTLADQVRRSVRSVRGNQWMFRMGHPADQPLRIRPELLRENEDGTFPILRELTPVRMDLTHSAWSDIFFLGMDFPEGAKVLNVSIDLGVHGRDAAPKPPVEAYLRVIDEPLLRLTSVDLGATVDITNLNEVFDFAKDYLGLLKAAVIASGIVPPGIEGSGQNLSNLLARIVGAGRGLELVSNVNNIPKGSRLAVSTNLLAALIGVCMRAPGQAESLTGPLQESERRLILARALLGEWIGGSGGGWQDSGGVWPGIKLIEGVLANDGDPEFGISRGRLMPQHKILGADEVSPEMRRKLQKSLVLVHGGMAQNVGPILEMVTEKYLLRSEAEWKGRQETLGILDEIFSALRGEDVQALGKATTRNFQGPLQTIIPWASNFYTESLITQVREEFGKDFWGFWMLGGMSGGGMGFIFSPAKKAEAQKRLQEIMSQTKRDLEHALPFAMEPVVYDFAINENGTFADLLSGDDALLPQSYYALIAPKLLRVEQQNLPKLRRVELEKFANACRTKPEMRGTMQTLFDRLLPRLEKKEAKEQSLAELLAQNGFDRAQHEQIRADLKDGRIGLAQNRLPQSTTIEDVQEGDVVAASRQKPAEHSEIGQRAIANGEVAVVTLAAGSGTRWTQGAGVVKALHPFCKLGGRHRTFLETHLAKSRRTSKEFGGVVPHIFTTSYLTHTAIEDFLTRQKNYGYLGPLILSQGKSIGLRMIPTERDLRFAWEEMPQQLLDEQAQKVRESLHTALIGWAKQSGEASDYTDNLPGQCLHPVGHWYEVPNLLRNGTLQKLFQTNPNLKYLLLHNIDTLGANLDPALLGLHIESGACLSFEVITRRLEDRGGGLARVNGKVRLVEGLAMPREEAEFDLSFYNSMTTWIDLDKLLEVFKLRRADLGDEEKVSNAIRQLASRLPTYITLKDVKKRWGHGQEDIFPVAQFEKLWGDMTALPEVDCKFIVVPRPRGQQLKDQAQLDGWLRDGSASYVESLCEWT